MFVRPIPTNPGMWFSLAIPVAMVITLSQNFDPYSVTTWEVAFASANWGAILGMPLVAVAVAISVRVPSRWVRINRAADPMDYRGSWCFAIHADGLEGSTGFAEQDGPRYFFGRDRYLYPVGSYTAMTEAHLVELEQNGADVVDRLVRELLQGYRSYDRAIDPIRAQGPR